MQDAFYRALIFLSKVMGIWFFILTAWIIASGYFVLSPHKIMNSIAFYRSLYPTQSLLYHICCVWKQYHNFIYVFLDRWLIQNDMPVHYTQEGLHYIEELAQKKTGALILMSHLGNWEIGAYLMSRHTMNRSETKLLLFLGVKRYEQIERIQKEDLKKNGINIITAEEHINSPFAILEGFKFIRSGGFVSMAGDRFINKDQDTVSVKFLGHNVLLPETPFAFALIANVPIIIFFTTRSGKQQYHCVAYPPKRVIATTKSERKDAINRAAQEYANILEEMAKRHPHEWYHFETFFNA